MPSAEWNSFVYLYHCGVNGISPELPAELPDPDKLLALADRQAATGVIAAALREAPGWLSPDKAMELRLQAAQKNLHNRQRMEAALKVVRQLQDRGFRVTVLKGMSIAVLYQYPECRSSSDTDILIDPAQEEAVLDCMGQMGFQIRRREGRSNHDVCVRPDVGMFEVHVSLFDRESTLPMLWAQEEFDLDRRITLSLWGCDFPAMDPENQTRYLIRHLLKHFAHEWTSFRVFYDTALYVLRSRRDDMERIWGELRQMGGETLFQTFLSLLVRAGCWREEELPGFRMQSEAQCELLREDILRYDREEPDGFWLNYPAWLAYVNSRSEALGYRFNDPRDREAQQRRKETVLPRREIMERRYPVLKRHKGLYPVFWVHRAALAVLDKKRWRAFRRFSLKRNKEEILQEETPRMERMKVLEGMELLKK